MVICRMKVRVGLVGLGEAWEQRHLPALRALADSFQVRAVCEQVGHRAQLAAAVFGAETVDGFRALAAREDVDAILMLSPQWYGPLPILAACEHGKAIFCGHGVHVEPDQAEAICRRVKDAGVVFMAELLRRQSPATLRLKELIATRLGPPRLLFCHHRLPVAGPPDHPPGYFAHPTMLQELVELVDWCRYVVGKEPHWVTGVCHGTEKGTEGDYQMMSLDFSDEGSAAGTGAVAQISCGRYFPGQWREAIGYRPLAAMQVCCEHGIAFIDLPATVIWFDDAGRHQESLESERPAAEYLLAQFYRAVTAPVRKSYDLEDACRALAIVRHAACSFREGRRLAV
jgi:predicted dehydrogenase